MKKSQNFKYMSNENGSVIVIIALFMTVLIMMSAFVLDMGIAYNAKSRLQKAMDSSALAAVRELPITTKSEWENNVIEKAKKYAILNNIKSPELLSYSALDKDGNVISINSDTDATQAYGIRVSGEETVYYNFAKVLGINDIDINSSAAAKLLDISGLNGLMPFVLITTDINIIKNSPSFDFPIKYMENKAIGDEAGWYGAVKIEGKTDGGADNYRNAMINGSTKKLNVGDELYLEDGNMIGPTKEGYLSRILGHETCTEEHCIKETEPCKRIVIIPIVKIIYVSDIGDKTGNDKIDHLEILGFASVFLNGFQEYDKDGNLVPVSDSSLDKLDHKSVLSVSYIKIVNVTGAETENGVVVNAYNVKAAKLID